MWWDWCYDSWHECDENEIWHQCVHSHISFSVFTRFSICTSCRPFPSLSLVECYQWFRVARIFFAKKLPRVGFRENNAKLWKVCVKSLPVPFVFSLPFMFFAKKSKCFFRQERMTLWEWFRLLKDESDSVHQCDENDSCHESGSWLQCDQNDSTCSCDENDACS